MMTKMIPGRVERKSRRSVITVAATAVATALAVSGCSSDSEDGGGSGETVEVKVVDMEFQPESVTINAGDSVEWVWDASTPHDVVSDDPDTEDFVSELITEGTFSHTFEETGTFGYHCTPHPQMVGEVVVEG